ncbi:ficolin-1-like [Mizuhopecten yessoensis]|uniref:ficolin-1-like n=1 Tax=Mizuhopecten yessoensis TaxID=6573 RepID=UPI000B45838C|nr:ficolin-1-like [Mizuhopecten yessoensis]
MVSHILTVRAGKVLTKLDSTPPRQKGVKNVHQGCSDIELFSPSGVYRIALTSGESFEVYSDMETFGGPWTVIQNRYDGSEDFKRKWANYKKGFGDLNGEFWIGNDAIHALTQTGSVLRIELETFTNITAFAEYSDFKIAGESDSYRLSVTGFSGNVSHDAMEYHNGEWFSTTDEGRSAHCASSSLGAWWYSSYHHTNLNGNYTTEYWNTGSESHVSWKGFPESEVSVPLKKTRMMIRPTHGEMPEDVEGIKQWFPYDC